MASWVICLVQRPFERKPLKRLLHLIAGLLLLDVVKAH
uniref:Uncharacterized protein n=1 Tax=Anguilla anguilla TaxID=7936 RepID=A0A0E9VG19_ANGAN